ncbi:MAG: rod shape-determining protein, partial [Microgenomates group bacterium]
AVPSTATEIEQKAVEEVLQKCGASEVSIYEKAVVTGIGCGFNIFVHQPICIIDMGGGLIEISILSGGGVVLQKTLKTAGEHMNKIIYNYLYLKHGIMIGENSCEDLKIELSNFGSEDKTMLVRGKSLETGLPKSVKVRSSDVKEALLTSFNHIMDSMKEVVELAPPEIVDELYKNGVILTGGLAQIAGLDEFFSAELNLPVKVSEQKQHATINGILKVSRRSEQVHKLRIQLP